jgi:hypothetical protein
MINISAPKTAKVPNPDFEEPILDGDVWKVREERYPESRGYLWHVFTDKESAWRFYESK